MRRRGISNQQGMQRRSHLTTKTIKKKPYEKKPIVSITPISTPPTPPQEKKEKRPLGSKGPCNPLTKKQLKKQWYEKKIVVAC